YLLPLTKCYQQEWVWVQNEGSGSAPSPDVSSVIQPAGVGRVPGSGFWFCSQPGCIASPPASRSGSESRFWFCSQPGCIVQPPAGRVSVSSHIDAQQTPDPHSCTDASRQIGLRRRSLHCKRGGGGGRKHAPASERRLLHPGGAGRAGGLREFRGTLTVKVD
uniref:Uncharacterized protein n=1 Tax=Oryzias melastigma TaxID=30732 RepID=A0A3B3CJK8_ORYME